MHVIVGIRLIDDDLWFSMSPRPLDFGGCLARHKRPHNLCGPDDSQPCPDDDREDHDRADRQGNDHHVGERAQHSRKDVPGTFGQLPVLIVKTALMVVYRNLIHRQSSSGHQDDQQTSSKWFRGYL